MYKSAVAVVMAASAVLGAVRHEAPISGFGTFVPGWRVESQPGGKMVSLKGTVEEVHAELLKINVEWDEQFPEPDLDDEPWTEEMIQSRPSRIRNWDLENMACDDKMPASVSEVLNGIVQLRRVRGRPESTVEGRTCGLVSCSEGAAIWWCNDTEEPMTMSPFKSVANGAGLLYTKCVVPKTARPMGMGGHILQKGQGWSVVVSGDGC